MDLLKLEERLVPAPNLLVPTTTAGAPLGFVQNTNLAFSGALDIELLDTPTPASTGNFTTTVAATAGTASATASGSASVTGSGTNSLSISGSLADVNATLNSLTYTNSTTGAASLVVTARDSAGTPLTDTKTIYVNAANSTLAPTITTALADVAYTAETATTPVAQPTIPVVVTDPQGNAGLVVTTSNDNPNLINGITVAGTTPNFTLAITTKTGITGTAVVTVKVADSWATSPPGRSRWWSHPVRTPFRWKHWLGAPLPEHRLASRMAPAVRPPLPIRAVPPLITVV